MVPLDQPRKFHVQSPHGMFDALAPRHSPTRIAERAPGWSTALDLVPMNAYGLVNLENQALIRQLASEAADA
jgi:hypothetical protein